MTTNVSAVELFFLIFLFTNVPTILIYWLFSLRSIQWYKNTLRRPWWTIPWYISGPLWLIGHCSVAVGYWLLRKDVDNYGSIVAPSVVYYVAMPLVPVAYGSYYGLQLVHVGVTALSFALACWIAVSILFGIWNGWLSAILVVPLILWICYKIAWHIALIP